MKAQAIFEIAINRVQNKTRIIFQGLGLRLNFGVRFHQDPLFTVEIKFRIKIILKNRMGD